jgi:hypothetical protein
MCLVRWHAHIHTVLSHSACTNFSSSTESPVLPAICLLFVFESVRRETGSRRKRRTREPGSRSQAGVKRITKHSEMVREMQKRRTHSEIYRAVRELAVMCVCERRGRREWSQRQMIGFSSVHVNPASCLISNQISSGVFVHTVFVRSMIRSNQFLYQSVKAMTT